MNRRSVLKLMVVGGLFPGTVMRSLAGGLRQLSASNLAGRILDAKRQGATEFVLDSGNLLLDAPLRLDSRFNGIKIKAHPQGTWLLGATLVEGWEPVSETEDAGRFDPQVMPNIWRAQLPGTYYDGELILGLHPQRIATYPQDSWLSILETDPSDPHRVISFDDPVPGSWDPSAYRGINRLYAQGWSHQYAYFRQPIEQLDSGSLTTQEPNYYSYLDQHRFRFGNVVEGISQAEEYAVDYEKGCLYWYASPNWAGRETLFSTTKGLLEVNGATGISFEGVGFGACRGDAVSLSRCANVAFTRCSFAGMSGAAVVCTDDASTGLLFHGCDVIGPGSDGIILRGGSRKSLTSSDSAILDCWFSECGRIERSSSAVRLSGCGHTVDHCIFTEMDGAAIRLYNSGSPTLPEQSGINDCTIQDSYFERCARAATDCGAIMGSRDWSSQGNRIIGCVFENIQPSWDSPLAHTVAGIMLDDRLAGFWIDDCSFVFCQVGVHLVGGFGTKIRHCQFIDNSIGVRFYEGSRLTTWGPGVPWYDKMASFDVRKAPWSTRYPLLSDTVSRPDLASFGFATKCEISRCAHVGGTWYDAFRIRTGESRFPLLTVTMWGNSTSTWQVPKIVRRLSP